MSNVLSRSEMTKVSLSDIKAMAQRVYWSLWSQAREYGRDVKSTFIGLLVTMVNSGMIITSKLIKMVPYMFQLGLNSTIFYTVHGVEIQALLL